MPEVVVLPVVSRRQRKEFLELPWRLHAPDPHWIPPLRGNQKALAGFAPHPFYEKNEIQTFLAYREGQACGRIAAVLNHAHNALFQERRGFFGFFESVDDGGVSGRLFDAVREWFRRRGIRLLRGPMSPSLNYEVGTLVEGFGRSPTFGIAWNPPYYARLIEGYGFRKAQDLYVYEGHISELPEVRRRWLEVVQQIIAHHGLVLRPIDRRRFQAEVLAFLEIYNRSLKNTWGFVPMSDGEVRRIAAELRRLIIPELAIGAEIDGRLVGAVFGLPDYSPHVKRIDGRLLPLGFIHLRRAKRRIKRIRVLATNVLPEYQLQGLGLALLHSLVPKVEELGIEEAEFSWVLESNALSRGALEKGGARRIATLRLYDYDGAAAAGPQPSGEDRPSVAAAPVPAVAAEAGAVEIRQVACRRDREAFIRLPWEIYAGDRCWVPPLILEVKEFLDPKRHPFYRFGATTQFLALARGRPVGRVLVSDDPHYNATYGCNQGCFGMFECADRADAAHALLDAAAGWLRARGRTALCGPIDYSTNYPCGLLVDGFDTPPRFMMNHNPPYYAELLTSWGLAKCKDLYAWWFEDPYDMAARWRRMADWLARRGTLVVRNFRLADFANELQRCADLYASALKHNWGTVVLSPEELAYLAARLRKIAIPQQVLVAEREGEPVGLSVTLPDLNEAIQPLNGRLTKWGLPVGAARLLWRLRRAKTARMMILLVKEGFRRRGVAELLILRTLDYGKNVLKYTGAELSWTLEDNTLINHAIEAVGARRYKTYRVYEKGIGE